MNIRQENLNKMQKMVNDSLTRYNFYISSAEKLALSIKQNARGLRKNASAMLALEKAAYYSLSQYTVAVQTLVAEENIEKLSNLAVNYAESSNPPPEDGGFGMAN